MLGVLGEDVGHPVHLRRRPDEGVPYRELVLGAPATGLEDDRGREVEDEAGLDESSDLVERDLWDERFGEAMRGGVVELGQTLNADGSALGRQEALEDLGRPPLLRSVARIVG